PGDKYRRVMIGSAPSAALSVAVAKQPMPGATMQPGAAFWPVRKNIDLVSATPKNSPALAGMAEKFHRSAPKPLPPWGLDEPCNLWRGVVLTAVTSRSGCTISANSIWERASHDCGRRI